jgi:hypothetical protein
MRLKIENDLSGNQIITRSFEFGAGVSAEVPVINSPIPLIKGVPKASIELKGLVGQSIRFNDYSDTTKKAKAAYLVESFGIGGIALNPFAGIYITALKNTLVDLNPDLSNLYSTYHYSDILGASAEGGLSVDFSFKYGNTKFDLLEASSSASLSANFEEFMNNKRSLNISYARSFNMSTLDLSILNNTIDFGDQLGYEYGGKIVKLKI